MYFSNNISPLLKFVFHSNSHLALDKNNDTTHSISRHTVHV